MVVGVSVVGVSVLGVSVVGVRGVIRMTVLLDMGERVCCGSGCFGRPFRFWSLSTDVNRRSPTHRLFGGPPRTHLNCQ